MQGTWFALSVCLAGESVAPMEKEAEDEHSLVHQQHKEDAFSESLKKEVRPPFQETARNLTTFQPLITSIFFSVFIQFPYNKHLFMPNPFSSPFSLSLPLVLENVENTLHFGKLGSQTDERRNKTKEIHPIWQTHFDLDPCLYTSSK